MDACNSPFNYPKNGERCFRAPGTRLAMSLLRPVIGPKTGRGEMNSAGLGGNSPRLDEQEA